MALIELSHISKRFGALAALDDVSLAISGGEVLGLLGENGAGKSTLMHILFGMIKPTAGTIRLNRRDVRLSSPRAAQRAGIGMVHQHFKLVPTLTVLENFALFIRSRTRDLRRAAQALLHQLHWTLPLAQRVEALTVGQQQRVEILKALLAMEAARAGARTDATHVPTLILDEPTAVLTPQEATELFAAVRTLREAGTGVVLISHKLAEVRAVCDRVAILRRGKLVHAGPAATLSAEAMAEKMVGAAVALPQLARTDAPPRGPVVLELTGVTAGMLKNVSLQVRAGEIVGIAGVDGNGQSELARTVLGVTPASAGQVLLEGSAAGTLRQRVDRIAFIAEDRHSQALALPLSVEDNLLLKNYRRPPFSTLGWLRFAQWRRTSRQLIASFDVRCGSPADAAGRLSGGNQQKVVLARELGTWAATIPHKQLVLAINPTRGLDVGATAFVLKQLLNARTRGAGVLLIHSDLDELLAVSDRVLVLYNGTLTPSQFPRTGKDEIGRLMLGLSTPPPPAAAPGGAA